MSLSPVRAWRRRRPCQSQVTTAGAALTDASGSKARGLWPFTSAAGGGGPEAVVAEQALVRPGPSRAPPSYSGIAALCSVRGWRSGSRSLRGQSSPRTGQAEAGASGPDSSGPREAGSTWTSLWSSVRCEPGAGWRWQA